jgi:hypothetical protein
MDGSKEFGSLSLAAPRLSARMLRVALDILPRADAAV